MNQKMIALKMKSDQRDEERKTKKKKEKKRMSRL